MEMNDARLRTFKTLCGALHYTVTRYGDRELRGRDWELLCSHLHLPVNTIHHVEAHGVSLTVTTKIMLLKYRHDDLREKRRVELLTRI